MTVRQSPSGPSVLGLIPARGGSKGVPRKNVRQLGGIPLIEWSIRAALCARLLASVVVTTEDDQIADVAQRAGARVPFRRPRELARDDSPTLPVVQHALDCLASLGEEYDAVVLLQPTSPFRSAADIDQAIELWNEGDHDTVLSVRPIPSEFHPRWAMLTTSEGTIDWAMDQEDIPTQRQRLDEAYCRDGAIYLSSSSVIRSGSLFGRRICPIVLADAASINIDTPEDWLAAESAAAANEGQ